MNIGDLVRSLHGSEEGFITKIIDNKTIEIEIEDGFTLPILKKDVVVITREETTYFESKNDIINSPESKSKVSADQGIFISFIPSGDFFFDLYFINNTDYAIYYTFHQVVSSDTKGLSSGSIVKKQSSFINKWSVKEFDQWGTLKIDILYYQPGYTSPLEPLHVSMQFHAKSFFSNVKPSPVIGIEGHVYQVDQVESKSIAPLRYATDKTTTPSLDRPDAIVDLHAEKLPNQGLHDKDVLQHQLDVFQNNLDAAIATGMQEITFIHGNGNGTLKSIVHKVLSENIDVEYYQDAQKSKFGYGATYVKLK